MTELTIDEHVLPSGLPVYVATPTGATGLPTVVWMHERYGFVEHTADYARKIAERGYAVIAPDFYYDFPDQEGLHKGDARYGQASDDVIDNGMVEAIAYLGATTGADTSRIGMIGVCASGRWPIVYGSRRPMQAATIFYGATNGWEVSEHHPERMEDMVARIDMPVLGFFSEKDHTMSVASVTKFRDLLEATDKDYDITIYEGAPHGFINDTMPGRYLPDVEKDAFEKMIAFFDVALAEDPPPRTRVSWQFRSVKSTDYDFTKNVRLA